MVTFGNVFEVLLKRTSDDNIFFFFFASSYYALSALGPAVRPYLWWKRFITQAQIGQFVLLFIHSVYFTTTQVGYSPYYTYHYIATTIIYCALFGRFYLKAYRQQQQQVKKAVVVLDKKEK